MALTSPVGFSGVATPSNASTDRIKPNVVHPLLIWDWPKNALALFLQKGKKGATKENGDNVVWYENLTPPMFLLPSVAVAAGSTLTIQVSDADALFLSAGDYFQIPKTSEVIRITVIGTPSGGNTPLTVTRNNGSPSWVTAAGIAITERMRLMGHSLSHAGTYRTGLSQKDTKFINYWDISTDPFEVGREYAKIMLEPNDFPIPEEQEKSIIRHKRNLEHKLWWGQPNAGDGAPWVTNEVSNNPSNAAGVWPLMRVVNNTDLVQSKATLTENDWLESVELSSHYGNNLNKVAFIGSKVATGFDRWGLSRKFEAVRDEFTGAKIFLWYSSFYPEGLPIVHTEALSAGSFGSDDTDWAFILDMGELTFHYLEGEDTQLDTGPGGNGLQNPGDRLYKAAYSTMHSLTMKGTDRAHLAIKDILTVS